jgi:hypothetical protein
VFLHNLGRFTDRLGQINGVAQCAYSTDRLAVRIYQSRQNPWAIGVAGVVRGRVGAVAATAVCYLLQQIPLLGLAVQGIGPEQDRPTFCFGTGHDRRGGQDYALVWIGSSTMVCDGLQNGMVHGEGRLAAVKAASTVALRSGPSTGDAVLHRLPDGTLGRVTCVASGEDVHGDSLWARTDILGETGWIAGAYLDSPLPLITEDRCAAAPPSSSPSSDGPTSGPDGEPDSPPDTGATSTPSTPPTDDSAVTATNPPSELPTQIPVG